MSTQTNSGIQQLLEAEKVARSIVEKARQHRIQRLKDARQEAKREIEEYAVTKEKEFKDLESKASGVYSQAEEETKKQVEENFGTIKENANKNSDKVVEAILAISCNVK
ncbi:V-type ATPase subunit G [Schizosaccharomyces cryophilus OY26]|uniref:V-type proton ATPase subunit G n=1 Tax=Schizosaccharomyces cryophilus (strain OY26 / ATCC MYA-4695 / CBS 11777 / NBRC 106824 / NRRL Y48691) TaxID=653667 RepID=S9WZK7_SCHCR|nr:V-type ATPase subunit G [Schizosaccharomyces cryophilus OY26]EPY50157.1 V-type ATPase subunit G [Schizosaccharomyces cryophilus OY26]